MAKVPRVFLVALLLGGCGASGDVTGGALRGSTAAATSDAAIADSAVSGASTWSAIYTDYFGPKGVASCTASGTCHGDASQIGASKSGFICGTSEAACYDGMIAAQLFPVGGTTQPDQVNLRFTLRTAAGGSMPKASTFVFSEGDLARIDAWLRAGASR